MSVMGNASPGSSFTPDNLLILNTVSKAFVGFCSLPLASEFFGWKKQTIGPVMQSLPILVNTIAQTLFEAGLLFLEH